MKARKRNPRQVAQMGGKARAAKLTAQERSEAARKAVNARWQAYRAKGATP